MDSEHLPHGARHSNSRGSGLSILTPIIAFFKRKAGKNIEQIADVDVHPEIAQLQREISTLKKRFVDLENTNRSVYGSCQPSSLDISRGLHNKSYADSLSEYSDCRPPTIDIVVQVWNRPAS